jgi:predicted nucleotidyltransferase/predicted transcriptional regulator
MEKMKVTACFSYTKVYERDCMVIHRVFDEVFRSWSHVAVLRALVDTATGFSGNEVARVAGMTPASALKALTSLEQIGIVNRQRGGRDHLFTLNRDHVLLKKAILALYRVEREFPDIIFEQLSTMLKKSVISAAVFGSVARKEESPMSDLDLCCVVTIEKQKKVVRELLEKESPNFYRKFGVKLAPVLFTLDEFRRKSDNRLIQGILNDNRLIVGQDLWRLLDG